MIKNAKQLLIVVDELLIVEGYNGYYIEHLPSRDVKAMGDGADMYHDEDDNPIHPGTKEFAVQMNTDLESNYNDFIEAYFPE